MSSIEESDYPLVFKIATNAGQPAIAVANLDADTVVTRVHVRALTGMQKEAVVIVASAAGERTCFLHAAMRGSYPSVITAKLNGEALPLKTGEI